MSSSAPIVDHAHADRPAVASMLPYLPALDGLRGLSVAGVLLFHGGVAWMGGGFLGVSTFFTLSGFLITSLLVRERAARGSLDVGRFWARRFRRLMPAALLTIALTAVITVLSGDAEHLSALRGDGLAALAYGANWRFLASAQSYAELFGAPSPLLHFWSLAIEEQFYVLFPLVVLGVARCTRGTRRALGTVVAVLFAASALAPVVFGLTGDRVYYGTDTRASELLAGSLLAIVLARRPLDAIDRAWSRRTRSIVAGAGAFALVLLVWTWIASSTDSPWVYRGGLPLYAVLSSAVIVAALLRGNPVRRALSFEPLRRLGTISYGVYLYHWPIFGWFGRWTAWPTWPRLAVCTAITLGVATLSYRYVEQPIRDGRGFARRIHLARLAPLAAGVVAVAVVVATISVPTQPTSASSSAAPGTLSGDLTALTRTPIDESPVSATGDAPRAVPVTNPVPPTTQPGVEPGGAASSASPAGALTPPPTPPVRRPSRTLRVLVVGDSTALFLMPALHRWGEANGVWVSANYARIGCGIGRGGERVNHRKAEPIPADCGHWAEELPAVLQEVRPDIVVVTSGFWDATDRRLPGDATWRAPGDPVYDAYLLRELGQAADLLASTGAVVAWIDNPPILLGLGEVPERTDYAVNDPARMRRLNELLAEVAATRPRMRVVPYTRFLATWPGGTYDRALRPDGIHVDDPGGDLVAAWMAPTILDAYWTVLAPEL